MQNTITQRIYDFLKQFPPFQFMAKGDLLEICGQATVLYLDKDEVIFERDQTYSDRLYIVQQGAIKLTRPSKDIIKVVDICDEGDLFGLKVTSVETYRTTATANEETILYTLPMEEFSAFAKANKAISNYLIASFASNIKDPYTLQQSGALLNTYEPERSAHLLGLDQARYSTSVVTCTPKTPIQEAARLMQEHQIGCIIIVDDHVPLGILTNRDLRFETNLHLKVSDLMTKENLVTTQEGTTLQEAKSVLQKHRIEKLPVIDSKGNLKGLITIKDIEKSHAFPNASKDSHGRLLVAAATGVGESGVERAEALMASGCDVVVIDTAHGHSKNVLKTVESVRALNKDVTLVGGNVVSASATEALIKAGVDVVKVGVGSGSICTTRVVSGVGVPQVTAVMKCSERAAKFGKTVISDGGAKFSGDVVKALAVGANSVMLGSMLAGCDESPGETILYQGRTYKVYRGMGSLGAMMKGSKDRYFQESVSELDKLVPEGIEGRVPYKGSVSGIIHQVVGGIKSGMGYCGASSIQELQERAEFVEISVAGLKESHVHDVTITKESPNYRLD